MRLTTAELDAMVEEATVDAYEQFAAPPWPIPPLPRHHPRH
ncbi:hypothetical protein [Streptomyces sp. UNOC14_S4]|nr:hypothetical protein [Streptomyces sp. UNOC14_S4]